jgi:arylsulfatase
MPTSKAATPNVLLVVLDSVRARNTSLHGHYNDTTPFLSDFAERSTVFAQARAPGTESISSHTSIFTGLHVREHGVTDRRRRLRPGETVWETLRDERGYETGVFSNNPFITELPVGLKDVFSTVVGRAEELPFPEGVNPKTFVIDADEGSGKYLDFLRAAIESGRVAESFANGLSFKLPPKYENSLPAALRADDSAEMYATKFLDWQAARTGPWAACVNFMDAHYAYDPGEAHDLWGGRPIRELQSATEDQAWEFVAGHRPWGQRRAIESLYDGAIRRADAQVARIVRTLRDRGALDETLVVVTADHGEGFGERSRVRPSERVVGHGNGGLHEALLHVPLVVNAPGQSTGATVDEAASLTRFPAVVEEAVAGADAPAEAFVPPDGIVISSTDGIDPDTQEKARAYLDDLEPLVTPADAVYRDDGGGHVRKSVCWGDASATVTIRDAQNAWLVEGPGRETVRGALETVEDAGVRVDARTDVDESVQRRLDELGYA